MNRTLMQFRAFTRRTAAIQRRMMGAQRRAWAKFKSELRDIDSFDILRALEPPEELVAGFAGALTQIEIAAYVDGRLAARKQRGLKRRKAASIMEAMTAKPVITEEELDEWIDTHVDFAWDLTGVNAISTMAQDASDYSEATLRNLLDFIADDAKNYLDQGMSFQDWRDKMMELPGFESANPYHLRTNFDTAANGAFHAAKWHEIEEFADIFPYLRYVTMMDDRVREEHAELEGTIARVDDAFWSIYYPPNGYNCRCSVEQLMEHEAEADPKFGEPTLAPDFDPRFQKNTGKTNRIFT